MKPYQPSASKAARYFAAFSVTSTLFISALAPLTARAQDPIEFAQSLSTAFESVASKVTPSVVTIFSQAKPKPAPRGLPAPGADPFFDQFRRFFGDDLGGGPFGGQGRERQGLGTGVIVTEGGYILTNNHVIDGADEITVRLHDESQFKAELVGTDPRTDLAVIRIKAKNLAPALLGNSDDLKIGEIVVAAGNPFGLNNSITQGIVSAKGRALGGDGSKYEDFIQTDAAINPGNSGGPLVNLKGQVIGINTAIFTRSGGYMGIGFAIPINMARAVMDALIQDGKVTRGWLGVGIQPLTEELSESFNFKGTDGILISDIDPKGPSRGKLESGDIVTEIEGKPVKSVNELRNVIANTKPGTTIELTLFRNKTRKEVKVTLKELQGDKVPELEEEARTSDSADRIGATFDTLNPEIAKRLGTERRSGVVITSVLPDSLAYIAGLRQGDIVVEVGGRPIDSSEEFEEALAPALLRKGIRMKVETRGMNRFVFMKSNEE